MKSGFYAVLLLLAVFVIASCAQEQQQVVTPPKTEVQEEQEVAEQEPEPQEEEKPLVISPEVRDLLNKSKSRVSSLYYKYKGPETKDNFHEFYVKGSRIKYIPARQLQSLDNPDSYDAVYINNNDRTAQSYCDAAYCSVKGKKGDLNYDEVYLMTPLDWISGLKRAVKVGEEVIEDRKTFKVETDKGILWLDNFYGIPLKAEADGSEYRFQQISVGSVTDADVTPR